MNNDKGAMTIAEGLYNYKTDVDVILGDERRPRNYVLRTSFNSLSDWKSRHVKAKMAVFEKMIQTSSKQAAIIDNEVWVFGVDSTKHNDIVVAIKIAMGYYKVKAQEIISNVYVKNLNAENEDNYNNQTLVTANKGLYSGVCKALIAAAKELGVKGELDVRVFSHNLNPKIPVEDLYDALKEGGANKVVTDDKKHKVTVRGNDGGTSIKQRTNVHLATLKIK